MERLTIDWIKEILGYDPVAGGLFVSGGSMANFAALAVARQVKAPENFSREGTQPAARRMCVYASEETHHSIVKAATLLGIGSDNVRDIAVDEICKLRVDDLIAKIIADRDAGHLPFCVIANAGTANTGTGAVPGRYVKWRTDSVSGCMWTRATVDSPSSRRLRVHSSRGWRRRIRSRSIRTSGFICRWIAAASSIVIRKPPVRPSPTKLITSG